MDQVEKIWAAPISWAHETVKKVLAVISAGTIGNRVQCGSQPAARNQRGMFSTILELLYRRGAVLNRPSNENSIILKFHNTWSVFLALSLCSHSFHSLSNFLQSLTPRLFRASQMLNSRVYIAPSRTRIALNHLLTFSASQERILDYHEYKMRSIARRLSLRKPISTKRYFSASRSTRTVDGLKRVMVAEKDVPFLNEVTVREHTIVVDEPTSAGGGNKGPTPFVLMPPFCGLYQTSNYTIFESISMGLSLWNRVLRKW
jgi:hypothetical protein